MRQIVFCVLVMIASVTVIAEPKKYYCEVKGVQNSFSTGLKIIFDFGENPVYSIWNGLKSKQKLVDENGKEIPFNSMVDAGNYLSDKGWDFVQAYTSVYDGRYVQHWIFTKLADSPQEAVKGITTKGEYEKRK